MNNRWRLMIYAASVVGALGTLGFLAYAGGWRGVATYFSLWVLIPYAVMAAIGIFTERRGRLIAMTVAAPVIVGLALFVYYDAMIVHVDAQGALVFVFIPVYQLMAVGLVLLPFYVFKGKAK